MLDELKEQYRALLPDKVMALEKLLKDLHEGNSDALQKIRLMAHTLHETGASFGYPIISNAAGRLETAEEEAVEEQAELLMRAMMRVALADQTDSRPAVLIVDDDVEIANMLQALISSRFPQYPVVFARSGAEAMTLLRSRHYALILLDLLLPDMDGRHILGRIKKVTTDSPSVLVMSGVNKAVVREACIALGANAFIPKPFEPDEIAQAIVRELTRFAQAPIATISSPTPL